MGYSCGSAYLGCVLSGTVANTVYAVLFPLTEISVDGFRRRIFVFSLPSEYLEVVCRLFVASGKRYDG
jgi:hypothetical protein